MNRGLELPGNVMPMGAPSLAVATPLNDVQLVALIAAKQYGFDAKEAVAWASEIVAEAIVSAKADVIGQLVRSRLAAMEQG